MFYPRAIPQLYLMATSVHLFGESEWALRLPSVFIGVLAILAAYALGRRFLPVRWSIIVAFVVALLPPMISLSQTARMYGFYVTFVMLFALAIFRWERTARSADYLLAVIACLASVAFHALTVFSMLLFLYPGVVRASWRMLGAGAGALVTCAVANRLLGRMERVTLFSASEVTG